MNAQYLPHIKPSHHALITPILIVLIVTVSAQAVEHEPLALAAEGATPYRIVIPTNPAYGEELAAKELAFFLEQMTAAVFPIIHDDLPATEHEIVLGNTNRKSRETIPKHLQSDNWEGFTLFREASKLIIMGNLPRATLYGVYDFLDVELGVRFLTAEANHVPQHRTLNIAIQSRHYGPVIERRTTWASLGGQSALRNRMNGYSFAFLGEALGGVKWIGSPTHTFDNLVPMDKYFEEHPEYYSLIEGQRRRQYKGLITQLCLTNPDVLRIATETARSWLGPEVKQRPQTKHVVSVTVNDSPMFCRCEPCVTVNREEGVAEGGTKMRFVNAIARTLDREYGNVKVETMIYNTSLPKNTRPAPNVLIQLVHDPDWRYALNDPACAANRDMLAELQALKTDVGDAALYNWIKLGTYGSTSFLDPRPNLRHIAQNIRVMNTCGIKGFFCQTVQTRGAHMQDLRYYLLARALWRPHIDSRETIDDFCRLYYGPAAEDVLSHINYLHDVYGGEGLKPVTMADTTAPFDAQFIAQADATLAAAETKAPDDVIRHRVATCRLPIWKLMLDRAFGKVGRILALPVEWSFKIDPDDVGLDAGWARDTSLDQWETMRIDSHWTQQGEEHRGAAWYAVHFELPDRNSAPLAIWFGAIDGDADIFLDGIRIGEQKLPATSMWQHGFFIPLPRTLAPGSHQITVRVYKSHHAAGIWKEVAIIDMSTPLPAALRTAGQRFLDTAQAADLSFISESYGGKYTQTEKMYYPKVRYFLRHGISEGQLDPWVLTNTDLAHAAEQHNIQRLNLSGSRVTDGGMATLGKITSLQQLDLRMTSITASGLVHIEHFEQLEELDLWNTIIDDDALISVGRLRQLRTLNLGRTRITDDGLKHLVGLRRLEVLNVGHTKVTDAGLIHLRTLDHLKLLLAEETKILDPRTDQPTTGSHNLMALMPELRIRRR